MRFCWSFGLSLSLCTGAIFHQVLFLHLNIQFTSWSTIEVPQRKVSINLPTVTIGCFFLACPYWVLQSRNLSEECSLFFTIHTACVKVELFPWSVGLLLISSALWGPSSPHSPDLIILEAGRSQFRSPQCINWYIAYAGHSEILSSTPAVKFSPY